MFQMCFVDLNQGTASATVHRRAKLGTKIAVIWKNDDVYSTGHPRQVRCRGKKTKGA